MSNRLNERVKILKLIRQMLEEITIQLKFQASTVYEIVNSLISSGNYSELSFIEDIPKNEDRFISFSQIWKSKLSSWKNPSLKKEDITLLESIGTSFGTTDMDGQLSSMEMYKEEAKSLIEKAESEKEKKSKIYRSLGILSGILISIMIV